ncbi:MAG: lipopolysaccharide assembly protein LapA domain-containing protein [Firmicutes bacterium]|nr:lipopolysaccharide assembly protein LapA domain-containing protein [Bacillota bacterium]
MQAYIVLMLIFAIFVTLFAIFNATAVTVSFIFTEMEVSLALVIIGSALLGALLVMLFDAVKKLKTSKIIREANKKVQELEKQLVLKDEALRQRDSMIAQKEDQIKALKEANESNNSSEMVNQ